jgi:filamentous hemagglutinin family protein
LKKRFRVLSTVGFSLLVFASAKANPTGGAVVAGSATIGPAGKTLSVTQGSQNAIINWQTFSIASGETTRFFVPNSSAATLNRVVGGNPSAIYGTLQSNGVLFLINPSGILVGPTGRIDTAGFLGSTLDVSNQQFLSGGTLNFQGGSNASVDNEGVIHASIGNVYLIANQVKNGGTLSAPQGEVGLAAGSGVLLQQDGDEHLFVVATPSGPTRATGISNTGAIKAAAAELRAAGGNAYALAINNTGVIAATGYKKINGQVYLTADGGSISNSGVISAHSAKGKGGKIVVDASGASPSGTVRNSGTINASGTVAGAQGGSVTIKNSGGATVNTATGQILAAGGTGGKGGAIETSGKTVQLEGTISAGDAGTWLIDPTDVTIDNGSGISPDVNVATLENALNLGTSETVQAVGGNTDSGNIDLNAAITWTSNATLQLTATGNINLNAVVVSSGELSLSAGGTISDTAALTVSNFILQNGAWVQNSSTLPSFSVGNNFELENSSTFLRVTGGNGTTEAYQIVDVYGLQGLGRMLTANAKLMNNIDASSTSNWANGFVPIGHYDGISSNDAVDYQGTFNGQGFTIDGLDIHSTNEGTGLFGDTGNNAVIENVNLTGVNVGGNFYVGGLVGVANGVLSNVSSSGSVNGTTFVGGLLGILDGALTNGASAGTVGSTGAGDDIGGLVGYFQGGTISNSLSTANVNVGAGSFDIGGLVGINFASVSTSYASGVITAGTSSGDVGGLIGDNAGTTTGDFWDSSTAGVTIGVGSNANTAGVTAATTTQLMSQSFILSIDPNWNFSTVWTTNGGTTLPELVAVGSVSGGGGNGGGNTGGNGGGSNGGGSSGSTSVTTTTSGGVDGSGSNNVPPAITPQNTTILPDPGATGLVGTLPPPSFTFQGDGGADQGGGGALASASGNSGLVGAGDAAELGGGLNNVANPAASSALNLALGPAVYQNLSNALMALGDWSNVPPGPDDKKHGNAGVEETILGSGDVVQIGSQGVQSIPFSLAPKPLQDAMKNDALSGKSGH